MDHQKWLDWRRGGLGSSDAPVIMGVSPWKTKYQLWEEKVFGSPKDYENAAMVRGREKEEEARCEFERMLGVSVFPKNVAHESVDWMRASLDGIDLDGKVMVEIKCPGKEDHFVALKQKIPAKYFPQCQHQMLVTGLNSMFYFSFDGKKGVIVEVKRDQEYITRLWEEEHNFWSLKEKRTPPELCDRDFLDLRDNPYWKEAVLHWSNWKNILKQAEEKESEFKQRLLQICEGRNAMGAGIKLTRSMCEGRLDIQTIMKDYPDIPWEAYKKDPFEKISIKAI